MPKQTFPSRHKYDAGKLQQLERDVAAVIEDIYEYFDVENVYITDEMCKSNCFIHDGDNSSALNLYHNADHMIHYKCRTHQCEDHFGKSLIHMIRGGLSHKKYNWQKAGDKEATFLETVEFLLKFTSNNFNEMEDTMQESIEQKSFSRLVNNFNSDDCDQKPICSLDYFQKNTQIPSTYYMNKEHGFKSETLEYFNVGFCDDVKKPMFNRSIVPVLDVSGENIVGVTGRSRFEKCDKCGHYHDPSDNCIWFPKWRHSKGFSREKNLYNFSNAVPFINKEKYTVIVESPGNVWRLYEAGIKNAVAIFGTAFNDNQKSLLDSTLSSSLLVLMDNDEAGKKAAEEIKLKCSSLYNVYTPNILIENDIADTNTDKLYEILQPIITKMKKEIL